MEEEVIHDDGKEPDEYQVDYELHFIKQRLTRTKINAIFTHL